jgi:hypothetical protein
MADTNLWGTLFAKLVFVSGGVVLWSLLHRAFNSSGDRDGIELLIIFASIAFCWVPLFLAGCLLYILYLAIFWAIKKVIRIPAYVGHCYRRFWHEWTFPSRRFGWKSLRGFPDANTPLLSEAGCSHDCQTTSKLCQECYRIIEQSTHICVPFSFHESR